MEVRFEATTDGTLRVRKSHKLSVALGPAYLAWLGQRVPLARAHAYLQVDRTPTVSGGRSLKFKLPSMHRTRKAE